MHVHIAHCTLHIALSNIIYFTKNNHTSGRAPAVNAAGTSTTTITPGGGGAPPTADAPSSDRFIRAQFDSLRAREGGGGSGPRAYERLHARGKCVSLQGGVFYRDPVEYHARHHGICFTCIDPQLQFQGVVPKCPHKGCENALERKCLDPYRRVQRADGLCNFVMIMRYKGAPDCLANGHLGESDTILVTDPDVWSQFGDPDVLDLRYMIVICGRTAVTMQLRLTIERQSGLGANWSAERRRMFETSTELYNVARLLYHVQLADFPVLRGTGVKLDDPAGVSFIWEAGYYCFSHKMYGKLARYFFVKNQSDLHTGAQQGLPCQWCCSDGSYKTCKRVKCCGQALFSGQYTIVDNASGQVVTSMFNPTEGLSHIGRIYTGLMARRDILIRAGYQPPGMNPVDGKPFDSYPSELRAMWVDNPSKEVRWAATPFPTHNIGRTMPPPPPPHKS